MTIETHTHTVVREVEVRVVPQGGKRVAAYEIRDKLTDFDPRLKRWGKVSYTTSRAVALSYVRSDEKVNQHNSMLSSARYIVKLCEVWQMKDGTITQVNPIQPLPAAEKLK